jgi:hypothetical protein
VTHKGTTWVAALIVYGQRLLLAALEPVIVGTDEVLVEGGRGRGRGREGAAENGRKTEGEEPDNTWEFRQAASVSIPICVHISCLT